MLNKFLQVELLCLKAVWYRWPKNSFGFKSKNKTHFSFSSRTLLKNVFTILFHYLLPFFKQLHNSIFPNFLSFWSKNCSGSFYLLLLKRNKLKFFPLIEFCTDRNKWKSESSVSGEFVFSRLLVLDFLQPHGRTQQARLPCPSPSPGACLTHVR